MFGVMAPIFKAPFLFSLVKHILSNLGKVTFLWLITLGSQAQHLKDIFRLRVFCKPRKHGGLFYKILLRGCIATICL